MNVLLGFDPGGEGAFGWCVANDAVSLPLACRSSGLANDAHEAVSQVIAALPKGAIPLAAGIDAPLVWPRTGVRTCDTVIRRTIRNAGCKTSAGTVQSVNSLRGACLAQGLLVAIEIRERFPALPLTEAHPKALRWLLPEAKNISAPTEHQRDALLGAFSAWAMAHSASSWSDLYLSDNACYSPLPPPLHYFMPRVGGE